LKLTFKCFREKHSNSHKWLEKLINACFCVTTKFCRVARGTVYSFLCTCTLGNPTRTSACTLLERVGSSCISKRASRRRTQGKTTEERGVASMCYVYVHKACMPATNRIYLPPTSPPYLSVASCRSSIQVAFPLGILNLWYAHCALLILDHAYASWILQRSRKDQRDTVRSSERPVCFHPSTKTTLICLFALFPSLYFAHICLTRGINSYLARRSVTLGDIAFSD